MTEGEFEVTPKCKTAVRICRLLHPWTYQLTFESWPLDKFIPYTRNARTHSEAQVAQIAASVSEFGFNNPVLVDPNGDVIAGHGRLLAARKLGMSQVPTIVLRHLTAAQKQAFRIADNKLALNAGWDIEMLKAELESLAASNFDLDLTGFDAEELDELLAQAEGDILADADDTPQVEDTPVSCVGDLWLLGPHRVRCGDGTSENVIGEVLDGRKCDMVFTDLPYNVDYTGKTKRKLKIVNDNLGDDFSTFLDAACRAMVNASHGALYICMSSSELHRLQPAFERAGGHWSTYIIWAKNTFTLGRSDYQRQYEPILYGWPEGMKHHWCGARDQGDVWCIDKPHRNDLHPTMKPVELVKRAVENSSRKGDLVLDPFAGSGSTLIGCEQTGRSAALVELDPRYVDVIVRRWQSFTGRKAILHRTSRCFDDIAAERSMRRAA